jgi:hypothetical protein
MPSFAVASGPASRRSASNIRKSDRIRGYPVEGAIDVLRYVALDLEVLEVYLEA